MEVATSRAETRRAKQPRSSAGSEDETEFVEEESLLEYVPTFIPHEISRGW
jgi:hypothetical protein